MNTPRITPRVLRGLATLADLIESQKVTTRSRAKSTDLRYVAKWIRSLESACDEDG